MPASVKESSPILDHYDGDRLLLSELTAFGYDRHARSSVHLHPHAHRHSYEVCYLIRGSVEWWVGPEVHQLRRGDVYVTAPGEQHGGVDSMMHPCELYFFQLRLLRHGTLPGLDAQQTRLIRRGLDTLQQRCFPGSATILHALRRMHLAHQAPTPRGRIDARAALHEILITLLDDHDRATGSQAPGGRSEAVRQAMRWMDAHLTEPFHISKVAGVVGLGISRFHEKFVAEVGFAPGEYRTRRRVALARQRLAHTQQPVTRIGLDVGFSSSQYFATVFKRIVGLTPAAYRATHKVSDDRQPDAMV